MFNIFNSKNKKTENENILLILDRIDDFISRKTNSIDISDISSKIQSNEILKKLFQISKKLEQKTEDDLGLNGKMLILLEKMSDGDFSDYINLKTDDPYLNYFANSLNKATRKLHSNFLNIVKILKEYENGKYIKTVDTKNFRDGEIKEFLKGINSLKDSISNILKNNHNYGKKLETTSTKLNQNMKNIVLASDKQSKILDDITHKITATMHDFGITTNNTKQMQTSSYTIKKSASEGLKQANLTINSMSEIDQATIAITEAIEVIDQIAFQTNILSLNAAVEAATAGEAGKGFAVVASEVRNLASRSANAAKSIKELVQKANEKTKEGKEISTKMINGYNKLIGNINNTIQLIDKTTDSSQQQLQDIKNINKIVLNLQNDTKDFTDIAHKTNEISLDLDEISNKILDITQKTEFKEKKNLSNKQKELELA